MGSSDLRAEALALFRSLSSRSAADAIRHQSNVQFKVLILDAVGQDFAYFAYFVCFVQTSQIHLLIHLIGEGIIGKHPDLAESA
jgi:hypothetical protein